MILWLYAQLRLPLRVPASLLYSLGWRRPPNSLPSTLVGTATHPDDRSGLQSLMHTNIVGRFVDVGPEHLAQEPNHISRCPFRAATDTGEKPAS